MNTTKELLRAWTKKKRLEMSREEVLRLSDIIQQKIIEEINWSNLKIVNCYQAIDSLNEVRTDKIIDFVKQKHTNIQLTLQAQKENDIDKRQFDLILVPTLAFDSEGYRLGWGGGHYDRFLATQPQALKIGLCFRSGYSKKLLPREAHDIALDKIVTEI